VELDFTERRHSPRVATARGTIAALHVSVPARLLDLSPEGLLLACEVPLRAGSTLRVVSGLEGRRLDVELCVRHVSSRRDEGLGSHVVGGSFLSFDSMARQTITALLGANGFRPAGEQPPWADRGRSNAPAHGGVRRERRTRRPERLRPEPEAWISRAS
jgi:hypothetical protein